MGTQTTYFAYGYSGQNRPLVEGINTTEGTSAAGFYLDYGSFEEVFIGAAANSAEMPNSGVLTQFVSKSGGNSPSLSFYYDMEDESLQSRNLAADQVTPSLGATIRPDGNRLASYKNTNIGVGFPILRDRIWAFGAFLDQRNSVAAPPSGSFLDGTPVQHQAAQLHRQAHLPDEPEQQVRRATCSGAPRRSPTAPTAATSWARRSTSPPTRPRCRTRRAGSTRASGTAPQPEHVRRVPRRPVRLQLRPRQQHRRDPLRVDHAPTRCWAAAATGSCAGAATSTPARSATSRTTSPAARTT